MRMKIHKHNKKEDGSKSPKPHRSCPPGIDPEREREIFKVFQTFDLDGEYPWKLILFRQACFGLHKISTLA